MMFFSQVDSKGGCLMCKGGSPIYYHDFCDGNGRERMHRIFDEEGCPDSIFCGKAPNWFERHPFYTIYWSVVLAGIATIGVAILGH